MERMFACVTAGFVAPGVRDESGRIAPAALTTSVPPGVALGDAEGADVPDEAELLEIDGAADDSDTVLAQPVSASAPPNTAATTDSFMLVPPQPLTGTRRALDITRRLEPPALQADPAVLLLGSRGHAALRSANNLAWHALREVHNAAAFEGSKLPPVGDRRPLRFVVEPAERLSVRDCRLSAPAVRVNMVGFELLCLPAPTDEERVVFATATSPGDDLRLVRPGESPRGITHAARMCDRVYDTYPDHREKEDQSHDSPR